MKKLGRFVNNVLKDIGRKIVECLIAISCIAAAVGVFWLIVSVIGLIAVKVSTTAASLRPAGDAPSKEFAVGWLVVVAGAVVTLIVGYTIKIVKYFVSKWKSA